MYRALQSQYPKGLGILFFTEMWERFSYYGMRALLVLFMTQKFGFSDDKAYGLYGAYGALVYATPVIGGIIADRLMGFKKAIILGGFLIMLGHICLAVPHYNLFYFGLAFIITGTGFLKPSISSTVGQLYTDNDTGRDSGFTLFYMGINIGAMAASILVGIVATYWGWHAGFALAAIGMMLGLGTFLSGLSTLSKVGQPPNPQQLKQKIGMSVSVENLIWLGAVLAVPLFAWLVQQVQLVGLILAIITFGSFFFVLRLAWVSEQLQRNRLLALLVLMILSVMFFALFEQAGSSMTLFTERSVERYIGNWFVPTPVFQSLNPFFIILLAPLISMVWLRLSRVGKEPSTPTKFFLGLLFVALSFGLLAFGSINSIPSLKSNMIWIVLAYFLQTVGELCLSPVGLAAVTRLSPPDHVGMLMGLWFLAAAFSNYLASLIAKLSSLSPGISNISEHYSSVFFEVFLIGLLTSLLALILIPLLKRLINSP
jgi:POT family proton-dependent oligopeptide transporter